MNIEPGAAPNVHVDGDAIRVGWPTGGETSVDLGGLGASGTTSKAAVQRPVPNGGGHNERVNQ